MCGYEKGVIQCKTFVTIDILSMFHFMHCMHIHAYDLFVGGACAHAAEKSIFQHCVTQLATNRLHTCGIAWEHRGSNARELFCVSVSGMSHAKHMIGKYAHVRDSHFGIVLIV